MALPYDPPVAFAGVPYPAAMNPPEVLDDLPASSDSALVAAAPECKGIRATGDFPRDLSGLSPEQIAHTHSAMQNSRSSGYNLE